MVESTVKQRWNLHNFVLWSVFVRPRWRKAAELLLLRIMGTLKPSFSRTVFPFFSLFFFHFPFLIFLPRIFKLKSLIIKLFHTLKKDKWLTDKFSFENEGPSETSKSVASIYARAYPDVQLNYGKNYFLKKNFFIIKSIGMTDTFSALYWCVCGSISLMILLFYDSDGVTCYFFP